MPPPQTLFYPISEDNNGGKVSFTALVILAPILAIVAVALGGLFLLTGVVSLTCKLLGIHTPSDHEVLKRYNAEKRERLCAK